jgi:hypothetical protein
MQEPETIDTTSYCACSILEMVPDRAQSLPYTYICSACNRLISFQKYNDYDRHFGYSGYDEDERDEVDNESADTD